MFKESHAKLCSTNNTHSVTSWSVDGSLNSQLTSHSPVYSSPGCISKKWYSLCFVKLEYIGEFISNEMRIQIYGRFYYSFRDMTCIAHSLVGFLLLLLFLFLNEILRIKKNTEITFAMTLK